MISLHFLQFPVGADLAVEIREMERGKTVLSVGLSFNEAKIPSERAQAFDLAGKQDWKSWDNVGRIVKLNILSNKRGFGFL